MQTKCPTCSGKGSHVHDPCAGHGWTYCNLCDKDGRMPYLGGLVKCMECNGTKRRPCRGLDGCGATGMLRCLQCHGRGVLGPV